MSSRRERALHAFVVTGGQERDEILELDDEDETPEEDR